MIIVWLRGKYLVGDFMRVRVKSCDGTSTDGKHSLVPKKKTVSKLVNNKQ